MVLPSDNEIYNFCPIQHPADDNDTDVITTNFDYHLISGRLLKLNRLGHDYPTVLRILRDLTGADSKIIPLNDEKVISKEDLRIESWISKTVIEGLNIHGCLDEMSEIN